MNTVFIVPTGLGCTMGGHAGDATPAAKLIAEVSDTTFLHPNVVNASDINEIPGNSLYVEGSILDRFLEGEIGLKRSPGNRVIVAVNSSMDPKTVNAVNAARSTIGMNIQVEELNTPLLMEGWVEDGQAAGRHYGVESLCQQFEGRDFDALAVATSIQVGTDTELEYLKSSGGTNPWGWIEARVSRYIADRLGKPVAHAPVEYSDTENNEELIDMLERRVVDPRKAAEVCSSCYLHCVLKGLHKAPKLGKEFVNHDIGTMVTPYGCIGRPHQACFEQGIPVIAVRNNRSVLDEVDDRIFYVDNYMEAAGLISCWEAGMDECNFK